jgi:hypothetical protein
MVEQPLHAFEENAILPAAELLRDDDAGVRAVLRLPSLMKRREIAEFSAPPNSAQSRVPAAEQLRDRVAAGPIRSGSTAVFALFRWLVQSVVKVGVSIAAGGGVSLLAIGALAMYDPERWDYHVLDHAGPPIGPLLLSIGAGLATTGVTLHALFFPKSTPSSDGRGLAFRAPGPVRA